MEVLRARVLGYIDEGIAANQFDSTGVTHIPEFDAQATADALWDVSDLISLCHLLY